MKKESALKYITVIFFFGFIFVFPLLSLINPDEKISEFENKILTQLPKLSLDSIKNGSFMRKFDSYSNDQFPYRTGFIEIKNTYSYSLGLREFRDIYVGKDGRLMEKFIFNKEIVDKNISQVTNFSRDLYNELGISSKLMIIPTSIAFYEDNLPKYAIYDNQEDALDYIQGNLTNNKGISFYTPYEVLKANKDEYIYFNTDHHWTQFGAYLAYKNLYYPTISFHEAGFNNEIIPVKISDDFYGSYYSKALLPNIKDDSIYSYEDFNNFKIDIDFDKSFDTLYDKNKLNGKNKYQYFLHGDPAIAVISGNKDVEDEILIFKDSFAHNFVPFLTSNYKKIHLVDPRYYNLETYDYLKENPGINQVMFINNLSSINSVDLYKNLHKTNK